MILLGKPRPMALARGPCPVSGIQYSRNGVGEADGHCIVAEPRGVRSPTSTGGMKRGHVFVTCLASLVLVNPPCALAQTSPPPVIPEPEPDPFGVVDASDPIILFANRRLDADTFRQEISEAVAAAPSAAEARATVRIAKAQRLDALSALLPSQSNTLTSFRVIDRYFSGSNATIIERSRPRNRTDYNFRFDQLVFDWMASPNRLRASAARVVSAENDLESTRSQAALEVVAAWYDAFAYHSILALSDSFGLSIARIDGLLRERVKAGASSDGDLVQIAKERANNDVRRARFAREAAQAEARYLALTQASPDLFARAPRLGPAAMTLDFVMLRAEGSAPVESARRLANASLYEARAAEADALPSIRVGVEGGRFGVFETEGDRETRATVTVSHNFSGRTVARIDEFAARRSLALARYERVRMETLRDARIAFTNLEHYAAEEAAAQVAYLSARRSRDVTAERFRLRSGTLFDLLETEGNLLDSALAYLEAMSSHDTAHYVLLSRSGLLLSALEIDVPGARQIK